MRGSWTRPLAGLSPRSSAGLWVASFIAPVVLWCVVSYVPFIWHPMVRVSDPGDVAWMSRDLLVERAAFAAENAEVAARGGRVAVGAPANPVFLPPPHAVMRALVTGFTTPPVRPDEPWLHQSLWHSIKVIFWGFLFSSLVGVPLGIMCGALPAMGRMTEPFIEFFRYLPAPAFGALAVAVLGIEDAPKVAIIFIGTFFQQVLVIANTTRRIDPALLEAAETLGASRRVLVMRVVVPGVITDIYTDMRVLLGWAWTYLIVAELIGVSSGITYFINQQAKYRAYERVFASIILIGLIGLVTDLVLASLGRQLFPWMRSARRVWFSALVDMVRGRGRAPPAVPGADGEPPVPEGVARMIGALAQAPEVSARFAKLKQRPVILQVRNLGKTFTAPGRPPTVALDDISFDLHRRELTCVIGPSGCGKSTLARLVAGLEEPTAGDMRIDGKPIHGPGADRGMVFQSYTLFPWLTVIKNVMFGLEASGTAMNSEAEKDARLWLELVGLSKFASAYPHQLSGGMKQRVAIARALANRPRMLLMDEPFGALDAQTRCQMQSYLLQIWKQVDITILFITHDLDEAVYLADRILVLDAHPGRVRELIEVPVPRPRGPDQFLDPTFIAARRYIEELIHPRAAQLTDKLPLFRMADAGDDVE